MLGVHLAVDLPLLFHPVLFLYPQEPLHITARHMAVRISPLLDPYSLHWLIALEVMELLSESTKGHILRQVVLGIEGTIL